MKYRKVRALNPTFDPRTIPRKRKGRKSNPCACQAANPPIRPQTPPPPVYPAEADVLRQLHRHRDRFLASPMTVPADLHISEIDHPGTSASVRDVVYLLRDRGLVDVSYDGYLHLNLSGQQMDDLREIDLRTRRLAGRLARGETK